AGATLTPAVQVTARDAQGNVATDFTGTVTVALGVNPGGATLSGTTSVGAASGVATFSTLSIDKVGTGYTLTGAATGLSGATSTAFNITPGTAAQLAFSVQPTSTTAGATVTPAVQVTAQDAQGNTATGFTGATSAAFNITPGTAAQLAFTVQPTNTTAGATITPAVQVTARDAQGNTATVFTGTVTVATGANPSGGTLTGTTSVAAVA